MSKKKNRSKNNKSTRLGIDPLSIFKEIEQENEDKSKEGFIENKSIKSVLLSYIFPDPNQPRKNIDPCNEAIKELASSIKEHGFINFITVRKENEEKYIIVAGERRYTAAKVAGLEKIPVIISNDKKPVDYALIQMEENLQREDLNLLDELQGYNRLISEFQLKQKDIVKLVNKNKSYISKMMSLNKLSSKIIEDIAEWDIEVTRDILWEVASQSAQEQEFIWKKIRSKPIRSVFESVKKQLKGQKEKQKQKEKGNLYEAEDVWKALKKAVGKDKSVLLQYIPPKKVEKLLEKFGE